MTITQLRKILADQDLRITNPDEYKKADDELRERIKKQCTLQSYRSQANLTANKYVKRHRIF